MATGTRPRPASSSAAIAPTRPARRRPMAVFIALLGTFNPVAVPALDAALKECSLLAPDQRRQLGLAPEGPCAPIDPRELEREAAGMLGPRPRFAPPVPPSAARTLPELLCSEADTVIAMAKSVLRNEYPRAGGLREHHDPKMIEHRLYRNRAYLPAGASEAALKLSRLARDLRTEAAQWGAPCESPTETVP